MIGSDIVTRVRLVLQDAATRWADTELALWITDGCTFISVNRPDACVVNASMPLASGAKQSIAGLTPPGVRLLDVMDGVTLADKQTLDTHKRGWMSATPGATCNYVYDSRDPLTFYVSPPAPASGSPTLNIIYQRAPVAITSGTLGSQVLSVADNYLPALVDYVLFRCYSKDADDTKNAELAMMYLTACANGLGIKSAKDLAASPDMNSPGGKVAAGATVGGV
jgi:hypothetical protein